MAMKAIVASLLVVVGCTSSVRTETVESRSQELAGTNLAGTNLAGTNLAGTNLAGTNLAGTNLAGTNLAGTNLAGTNLAGTNLAGTNLAGTNLAGTNLAGTNLAGTNLAGTNLAGTNLAGTNLLYSGEDLLDPSVRCVSTQLGTALPSMLMGQTDPTLHVALGKLPWSVSNNAVWEADAWGDKTYCTFLIVSPTNTPWIGVAGFIKSIFRWDASVDQHIVIQSIPQSVVIDPTDSETTLTYTGMMDAGRKLVDGTLALRGFLAGEYAFASATTNNESVMVDFSAWTVGSDGTALILGNVQDVDPPTFTDSVYITLDNGDGTFSVVIDDASHGVTLPEGMVDGTLDIDSAYRAWLQGTAGKPVPKRCGGTLYLNHAFGEPIIVGKCNDDLVWPEGACVSGFQTWSDVTGLGGPNSYMRLGGWYATVVDGSCSTPRRVLSETYVHMWTHGYTVE